MSDDAAVVRLGARSYRNLRRAERKAAKLREQTGKLREATEAQIRRHRDFLAIERPEELLDRPAQLLPGQAWGMWAFDDLLYEHLAVIGIRNGTVVAQTEDGQLVAVDKGQLLQRGHFLGWVR
jgi:hypothetical protein